MFFNFGKFLVIIGIVVLIGNSQAKKVKDKIRVVNFNRPSWKYLTKFQLNVGTGKYSFRIKLEKAIEKSQNPPTWIPIKLHAFYDKFWTEVMVLSDCTKKIEQAHINVDVDIPSNGEWSRLKTG